MTERGNVEDYNLFLCAVVVMEHYDNTPTVVYEAAIAHPAKVTRCRCFWPLECHDTIASTDNDMAPSPLPDSRREVLPRRLA